MKHAILFPLLSICMLQGNSPSAPVEKSLACTNYLSHVDKNDESRCIDLGAQPGPDFEKMTSIEFKSQEYCRVELKDFVFDVHFSIVGATVYFSGTNFKGVEKATITSASLKPIRKLMDRCAPGTIVVFDDVKVVGPDNLLRTIPGRSIVLR